MIKMFQSPINVSRRLYSTLVTETQKTLDGLVKAKKFQMEIVSPQGPSVMLKDRTKPAFNFCANNYLNLANNEQLKNAAVQGIKDHGLGMASVRFICGTQNIHRQLERKLARFLGKDDAILYAAAFDANAGAFEALLGPEDAIISDALNHASIIDGIRLCKAKRLRYAHNDMADLERQLQEASGARIKLIATDGVFSMDGDVAPLEKICDLAEAYGASVYVDDAHATGVIGPRGRGSPFHTGVNERVEIITSTLGKALGGAMGGFTAGPAPVIAALRAKSRPYLFSNSLMPAIVTASLDAVGLASGAWGNRQRTMLRRNTERFRTQMTRAGFQLGGAGEHPISPVMIGDEATAHRFAYELAKYHSIGVVALAFPVVPRGQARIRVQLSSGHTAEEIDHCVKGFRKVKKKLNL